MGQKLQLGITVLHAPKLIILDEPFSGVDPVNSNFIKDEIYQLARSGSTIIFSTHRMEQVEEICNHIILVNKGEKILDGSVAAIKQQFKENLFSVGLEGMGPQEGSGAGSGPGPGESSFAGAKAFEVAGRKGGHLIVRIREGHRPNEVLEYFIGHVQAITAFTQKLPSPHPIFINLVHGPPLF